MENFSGLNARVTYERKEEMLSDVYHENSKMRRVDGQMWGRRFQGIRNNTQLCKAMSKTYKEYPNNKSIDLDKEFEKSNLSFEDTIINRRTTRAFSGGSITKNELSKLLYLTYGITISFKAFGQHGGFFHSPEYVVGPKAIDTANDYDGYQSFRASASGGGLYPLEFYVVINNVESIAKGLYHYNVRMHKLELLKEGDLVDKFSDLTFNEEWQKKASVHFIITSMMDRTRFKYLERGYRFVNIDLGHAMENLYLTATSCKLGCAAIGGFYDDEVNKFLGINAINETTMLIANVGPHVDEEANPLVKSNLKLKE
ncbi:SagB/ThcOx family dehydrogenase [Clostridium sp. CF011]|uniref:SagB/ThcOx family dehydrogenase n=1 Tax=Clostridium sp. CF011 TaxID=2843318 RepID=UPI001C0B00F2|nr:SagB/ThcOx family dehydrogenase [Clostridium sp. CF011]MBU3093525.1 SagB/ThcOx family dehydrogenase [Clostridium sp. CF011]WAG71738.1 SagB/ThcOx family dehydrogenase [Clostridium sp. CF011]